MVNGEFQYPHSPFTRPPFSVLRSPPSALRPPFSVLRSRFSVLRSPFSPIGESLSRRFPAIPSFTDKTSIFPAEPVFGRCCTVSVPVRRERWWTSSA
jgi:hypothetical protein